MRFRDNPKCLLVWPRVLKEARPALAAAAVIGVGYVVYMFQVDVPMYWTRWLAEAEHNRPISSLAQGLADASGRWLVSYRWDDWQPEVVWMTAYFSVAVCLSIGMIQLPARLALLRTERTPATPQANQTAQTAQATSLTRSLPQPAAAMKSTTTFSLSRVFRAAQYSEQGIRSAWRDEAAFRQELVPVLPPTTLWLPLPRIDTVLLLALMGLVLVAELLNSGLEAVVDMTSPGIHPLAAKAKDCGSAAVFVSLAMLSGAWLTLAGPVVWGLLAR